jgi:hypothetical protein
MPIDPQVLFEETKCYACYGLSLAQLLKAGLLNRIAAGTGGGGGSSVWGGITGTLSNQLDLQAALNAKTDLYTMTFYNSAVSPADATTYFLGQNGTAGAGAVQTTYNNVRVIIPFTGTVIAASLNYFIETTPASGEAVTISLNKNNELFWDWAPTIVFSSATAGPALSGRGWRSP